ncbi:hypothetical protein [Providencia sp. PROV036]|uniref:hypothetical protein n=1 Tax=Providencia sp. PROV036 TaxID=2949767 RepID=UPI00234AC4C4|nr:hypothetical protein [Providencia sp. PROV036]
MTITYADIRKKKKEIDNKRITACINVIHQAVNLVCEYRESLGLPKETWDDIQGNANNYVMVGELFSDGVFKEKSLNDMPVKDYKTIEFDIATVVDDSPRGGDFVIVHVILTVNEDNSTSVMLLPGSDFISVIDGRWGEACNKIKDATYLGIDKIETII